VDFKLLVVFEAHRAVHHAYDLVTKANDRQVVRGKGSWIEFEQLNFETAWDTEEDRGAPWGGRAMERPARRCPRADAHGVAP